MRVGAAGGLKAVVALDQAGVNLLGSGFAQQLIRPPAAGGEALLLQHVKGVAGGVKVLAAAAHHVRLHRRAQRVHIAVSMLVTENVNVPRQRVEVRFIVKIGFSHCEVALACAERVHQVEVFRDRVALVPVPGDVTFVFGAPGNLTVDGVPRLSPGRRHRWCGQAAEKRSGPAAGGACPSTRNQLVIAVGREAIQSVVLRRDRFGVKLRQQQRLGAGRLVSGGGGVARERRNPLSESGAWGEPCLVYFVVIVWLVLVPTPQGIARGGAGRPSRETA